MPPWGPPGAPNEVRGRLADLLRRNLIGPHLEPDPDLVREVIASEAPSNRYLTGYLVPSPGGCRGRDRRLPQRWWLADAVASCGSFEAEALSDAASRLNASGK